MDDLLPDLHDFLIQATASDGIEQNSAHHQQRNHFSQCHKQGVIPEACLADVIGQLPAHQQAVGQSGQQHSENGIPLDGNVPGHPHSPHRQQGCQRAHQPIQGQRSGVGQIEQQAADGHAGDGGGGEECQHQHGLADAHLDCPCWWIPATADTGHRSARYSVPQSPLPG